MTVQEIKAKLSEVGVPFPSGATKPQLEEIYNAAKEDGVFDTNAKQPEAEAPVVEPTAEVEPSEEVEESADKAEPIKEVAEETPVDSSGKFEVVTRLKHDGTTYEPGSLVELPAAVAAQLIASGVVK